jgi:hypothetical protein
VMPRYLRVRVLLGERFLLGVVRRIDSAPIAHRADRVANNSAFNNGAGL